MSAANKLRRRAEDASRVTAEAAKEPEAMGRVVKRRKC